MNGLHNLLADDSVVSIIISIVLMAAIAVAGTVVAVISGRREKKRRTATCEDPDEYMPRTSRELPDYYDEIKKNGSPCLHDLPRYVTNRKVRVLVGDYSIDSICNSIYVLETMGVEVKPVRSGYDIISEVQSGNIYDIIITNNVYSHCSGPQTLNKLRRMENFHTPVAVLTVSSGQRPLFINTYGFDEYMTKLLTQEQVMDVFPKLIKGLEFIPAAAA